MPPLSMNDTGDPSSFDDLDLDATLTGFRAEQKIFQRHRVAEAKREVIENFHECSTQ